MTQSLAERLADLPPDARARELAGLSEDAQAELLHDWRGFWARPEQVAPEGDWLVWLILAGRGWGKTKTGAEWVRELVDSGQARRIALVGETHKDLEEVMVFGPSGLASVWPPHQAPRITKKPIQITFHNGALAFGYNATEPEQLRGPQFDAAWADETAKWRYAQDTWDQLQFGLRLGQRPRLIVTTTPRPVPLIRELLKRATDDGEVRVTRGSTFDNRSNLAGSFLKALKERYEGTRLGRQEIDAEVLDDVPGALWTRAILDAGRVTPAELPEIKRVVVAVDPAITSDETSDEPGENGISVAAIGVNGHAYVLEDASLIGSPHQWASRAVSMMDLHEGDCLVVETNQGGEMVISTLRSVRPRVNIHEVKASRGKHVRAEPVAALYEQGRVHHVGTFAALEDQMTQMTAQGYLGDRSPDRLDALVWAITELFPAVIKPVRKEEPRPAAIPAGASWMAN